MNEATMKKIEEAKKQIPLYDPGTEIMELRLYIKDGKLLWVDPIDPKEFKDGKSLAEKDKEYSVDLLTDLSSKTVQQSNSVLFNQNSPVCSYWYIYQNLNGDIEQVCLY